MKIFCNSFWRYAKSPKTVSKCKLNYYVASSMFVGMTFFLYNHLKLFPKLLDSFFLDLLLVQLFYAAICAACGALLSNRLEMVKLISILTLVCLYLPMVVCIVLLKTIVDLDASFVMYSLSVSSIFLFLAMDLLSFRKGLLATN